MHSTSKISGTFANMVEFEGSVPGMKLRWKKRKEYIQNRLPIIQSVLEDNPCKFFKIYPQWLIAILWDEKARISPIEWLTDWLKGLIRRNPSVGEFQITIKTAQQIISWADWGIDYRKLKVNKLQKLLRSDFKFSIKVVATYICKILKDWKDTGYDPFTEGGLGPNKITPIELVGTLYHHSYKAPKCNPKADGRGKQIADWAKQATEVFKISAPNSY